MWSSPHLPVPLQCISGVAPLRLCSMDGNSLVRPSGSSPAPGDVYITSYVPCTGMWSSPHLPVPLQCISGVAPLRLCSMDGNSLVRPSGSSPAPGDVYITSYVPWTRMWSSTHLPVPLQCISGVVLLCLCSTDGNSLVRPSGSSPAPGDVYI